MNESLRVKRRLSNYCRQKEIDYINNANMTEDYLGLKKLHQNPRGKSFFARN